MGGWWCGWGGVCFFFWGGGGGGWGGGGGGVGGVGGGGGGVGGGGGGWRAKLNRLAAGENRHEPRQRQEADEEPEQSPLPASSPW